MSQLIPQLRILLACKPVDFRNGIDGLAALCKCELEEDPFSGVLFVFRNRRGTALKMLCYDGVGFWLVTRRFSQGRIRWWPEDRDAPLHLLEAQQLSVLLYNGLPEQAGFASQWRKVDSGSTSQAARNSYSSSGSSRA
jgi:transposase